MTDPYYADATVTIHHGDCLDVLRELPDSSVDAVVTDPPYGLEFMGKEWDGADGFRRSLNPADVDRDNPFGRTSRTSPEYRTTKASRGAVVNDPATERGGFQDGNGGNPYSRSRIEYGRGGGASNAFQQWCEAWATECLRVLKPGGHMLAFGGTRTSHRLACAVEDAGFEIRDSIAWLYGSGFPKSRNLDGEFEGWGTALKPAHEPIVVGRKPLRGTVLSNMLAFLTGALHINACRVEGDVPPTTTGTGFNTEKFAGNMGRGEPTLRGVRWEPVSAGRWPANLVLDESQAAALDAQSGKVGGSGGTFQAVRDVLDPGGTLDAPQTPTDYGKVDGASRFFYTAKAASSERVKLDGTAHPTVKPLALMRWLVRLVTPPGGTVLEPFAGSGTTVEACILEGFACIAIEREADYLPLIRQRIHRRRDPVEAVRGSGEDAGLFDLLGGEPA